MIDSSMGLVHWYICPHKPIQKGHVSPRPMWATKKNNNCYIALCWLVDRDAFVAGKDFMGLTNPRFFPRIFVPKIFSQSWAKDFFPKFNKILGYPIDSYCFFFCSCQGTLIMAMVLGVPQLGTGEPKAPQLFRLMAREGGPLPDINGVK